MPISAQKFIVPEIQNLGKVLFRFAVCGLFIVGLCGHLNGAACEVCGCLFLVCVDM